MVIAASIPLDAEPRTDLLEGPPPAAAAGSLVIRIAGLADIPAIARITQEGPPPEDIEPEVMSQATRMLLTLVAFEHGALWVEQEVGGPILRAVTSIPATQLPPGPAVLRDLASQLGFLAAPHRAVVSLGKTLVAELASVAAGWVLIEISKAVPSRTADPALLGAALAWTRAQPAPAPGPVIVLADSFLERDAAIALGFVEHRTWGHGWPWWLGIAPAAEPAACAPPA